MRVVAPGKMLLAGSYAVLRGAPAVVCAVDRHAIARANSSGRSLLEVAAAFEGAEAPGVDVSALSLSGKKLGLGSSAAAVVAALGYRAAMRGEDLTLALVREGIFEAARAAHARVQAGGSGVDVAASVHGGVLRYALDSNGRPSVAPVTLPEGLCVDAYWSGRSASTRDMRARVDAFEVRGRGVFVARMEDLTASAVSAVSATVSGDARAFVEASRAGERALSALGRDADVPIVVPEARAVVNAAEQEDAAFVPSGAGGGDVFVRLGLAGPSARFDAVARAAGFERLDLRIDPLGVRVKHGLLEEPLS